MPNRAAWCALLLAVSVSSSPAAVRHYLFGVDLTTSYDVEQNGTEVEVDLEPGVGGDLSFDAGAISTTVVIPSGQLSDVVPPGNVATLAAPSSTQSSVTLTWTAVGDDGVLGRASSYDIRYATVAITDANWQSATQVSGEPAPKSAGQSETFAVTGLASSTLYYFAMKVGDEVGNWSGLSNVVQRETQAPTGDTTAPAAVTNLAVGSTTQTTATLTWTAVGDDLNTGQASLYDIRYSTSTITPSNWGEATQVSGEPSPRAAGQAESFSVTGLLAGTHYYFALKVGDEVPNWSNLSNVPDGTTPPSGGDTTPPARVTDLGATNITENSITLRWTAVGDDGNTGQATAYDIRYSNTPLGDANWATAIQVTGEPPPRAPGQLESLVVQGLSSGTIYYIGLKVRDEVPNWSPLSNVYAFQTQGVDGIAPSGVTTLAVGSVTSTTATLTWTAVGDDGVQGSASTYDLRYASFPILASTWNSATRVNGEPPPKSAGQQEMFSVTGLTPGSIYYFALKVADEVPNWSPLSNVPSAVLPVPPPPDPVPPAMISNLTATTATASSVTLTWTAVGDDGMSGQASVYDLRYSTSMITLQSWLTAVQVQGEPAPKASGLQEMFTIQGLIPGTTYYFALMAGDEAPNWSGLSNVATKTTAVPSPPDTIPPAEVSDLAAEALSTTSIRLAWTAVGDDGQTGQASAYDLRYSDAPIDGIDWDSATRVQGLPAPRGAYQTESFDVVGLVAGTTYYFAIAVSDEAGNWSAPSNLATATTLEPPPQDTTPPGSVNDLSVAGTGQTTFSLAWTAVGDDGLGGRATQYDIRRAGAPIDESTWESSVQISDEPPPRDSGEEEILTIYGLAPNTTYFFAMRVSDEAGNWSGISNCVEGLTTPKHDDDPPLPIESIEGEGVDHRTVILVWTAPADDDSSRCIRYEGRYLAGGIDAVRWGEGTPIEGLPAPSAPGALDSVVVMGLEPGTTYGFAIRARDDADNLAAIGSPLVLTTTSAPDTLSPETIADLSIVATDDRSVTLRWTAPADRIPEDCLQEAGVESLEIRVGLTSLDGDAWARGETRPAPPPSTPGTLQEWTVQGLAAETTYYFAIRSRDLRGLWSETSNVPSAMTQATETPPDTLPPGAIAGLTVVGVGHDHVDLAWRAPGGDGSDGRADHYDVRYAPEPIVGPDWDRATRVQPDPVCSEAGTDESLRVGGLLPSTGYHFAMRAIDAAGNLGPVCPSVSGRTAAAPDTTPPSRITNLVALNPDTVSCLLRWTAPADDRGGCAAYEMRQSTDPIALDGWETAEPVPAIPDPLDPGLIQTHRVSGLRPGTRYYFAIAAIDASGNRSAPSNAAEIETQSRPDPPDDPPDDPVDAVPPARIDDLTATAIGPTEIRLRWTAVGDDGKTGRAAAYEIRRSPFTIGPESWVAAITVEADVTPGPAGQTETTVIGGLVSGVGYHFAIRVRDEADNLSGVSVDAFAETLPPTDTSPPAVPSGLTVAVDSDRISVSWEESPDPDVVDYTLMRWNGAVAGPAMIIDGLAATAYLDTTILPDVEYRYAVAARDGAGNISTLSSQVSQRAALEGFLPSIKDLRSHVSVDSVGSSGAGRVVIRWTAVPLARFACFAVDRSLDSGQSWSRACSTAPTRGDAYEYEEPAIEGRVLYRIVAVSPRGFERSFDSLPVEWGIVIASFAIRGPYPNPCAAAVSLDFDLPQATLVQWSLYDAQGRRRGIEEQRALQAGARSIQWEIAGDSGEDLPSGTYFLRVEAGSVTMTRKLTLRR